MSFETLGLSERVLAAVTAAGYREPTPIQAGAIPHVLQRRDVLGIAQTGTGKTASFVLPMLTLLEQGRARARMPRTLILEPTRELAAQVEENFVRYGANHKLTVALLIGGVSFDDQNRKLERGADVLIATPGRLLDHSERGKLLMQAVEILVIDEADRMLDMGFIPDIERICKLLPASRQTLFFSATMPPEITRLADNFLRDPVRVEVARPASTAETVTQRLVAASSDAAEKRDVLRGLMRDAVDLKNAIIFCNRKRDVQTLFRSLEKHGFSVGALHGDMEQRARMAMLEGFRRGQITFLVASDVAARGLDIPDVSHVYNFDVPHHAEDYVHRIGRTGRAGRSGAAFTLVTPADSKSLAAIEKLIGNSIAWLGEPVGAAERGEGRSSGRRGGERASQGGRSSASRGSRGAPAASERAPAEEQAAPERRAPRGDAPKSEPRAEAPKVEARDPQRDDRRSEERRPDGGRSDERRHDDRRRDGRGESGDARRPPRSDQRPAGEPQPRHRGRQEDREPPVIGLGDHVPAFLLRPIRPRKPLRGAEDLEDNVPPAEGSIVEIDEPENAD